MWGVLFAIGCSSFEPHRSRSAGLTGHLGGEARLPGGHRVSSLAPLWMRQTVGLSDIQKLREWPGVSRRFRNAGEGMVDFYQGKPFKRGT